jgi:NAD(P)-dependent dehydrogenase (short-subunit alcohol dehydrogenase family)
VIETPLFGKLGLPEANAQELAQAPLQQIPAKRFGKPEVATAVAFLASEDASYITGARLGCGHRDALLLEIAQRSGMKWDGRSKNGARWRDLLRGRE